MNDNKCSTIFDRTLLCNLCTRSLAELRDDLTKPEQTCLPLVFSTIPSQEVQRLIKDLQEFDKELLKVNLVVTLLGFIIQ